jgi:hypothetical protein
MSFLPALPLCLFLLSALPAAAQNDSVEQTRHPSPASGNSSAKISLSSLPLAFERNTGQSKADISWMTRVAGMQIGFAAGEVQVTPSAAAAHPLTLALAGADRTAAIVPSEKTGGESNYLLGQDRSQWRTHIAQYGRITYQSIYPGVDLTFYGNHSRLEHDFVVQPGADYRQIRMQYRGAKKLSLSAAGDLHVLTQDADLTLKAPTVYQEKDGLRQQLAGHFVLLSKNEIGFEVNRFDRTLPLVIDPILDYSTYLADVTLGVSAVAVDSAGNTYITGEVEGSGYPVTTGANNCNACSFTSSDVFITKLNPTGTGQVYSTVIGGTQQDASHQIAVDSNGNAIITVYSWSTDFPVQNSISSGTPSGSDGFIVSLAPDGASFNFSSRLGGSGSSNGGPTYPNGLALDGQNNIYVAGTTASPYFPVTSGALHALNPVYNQTGVFVIKLLSTGSLGFSAIVGDPGEGSGLVGTVGLALDSAGGIYIAGNASTTNFTTTVPWPTTSGVYKSALSSTTGGPFVTKISADGTAILWSTLLDIATLSAMTVTSDNQVIVAGTYSQIPVTSDAFASSRATSFIAKVSADGTKVPYASYFGTPAGGSEAIITNVALDNSGDVWVGGYTDQGSNVPMVNPLQSVPAFLNTFKGSAFVSEFDPPLHSLLFSTYFNGAQGGGTVNGIAFDPQNKAHIVGIGRGDTPTTSSSYLPSVPPSTQVGNFYYANRGFAAVIDTATPGPGICFSSLPFLTAQVGLSAQGSFTISNCGNADLQISSAQSSGSIFSVASTGSCIGTLSPGNTCSMTLGFTPAVKGPASGSLVINSNATVPSYTFNLAGTGTAPTIYLQQTRITFAPQVLNDNASAANAALLIVNQGTAPLLLDPTKLAISDGFTIVASTCVTLSTNTARSIAPNNACTFTFAFHPTVTGTTTGTFTFVGNDPANPTTIVSLSGSAAAAYPTPTISAIFQPSVALNAPAATLRVNGSNFFPTSYVTVGGQSLPTTYNGAATLSVTLDPSLLTSIGELPVAVVNPAPGGQSNSYPLLVYRSLPITAAALIYEPVSKMLYASIPATDPTHPNTILPIDPLTGNPGTPIPVGKDPSKLVASSDGAYLYVGANGDHTLQRVNLATSQVERTFTLPIAPDFNLPTTVCDMHVVPGTSTSVVATLFAGQSPPEVGTILVNDSGIVNDVPYRVSSSGIFAVDNFTFTSDPSTFYAFPFLSNGFFLSAAVNPSGITPNGSITQAMANPTAQGSLLVSDGSLLYTDAGQVWNPATKTLVGTYSPAISRSPSMVIDSSLKRTFFLDTLSGYQNTIGYVDILGYDQTNYQQIGSTSIQLNNQTGAVDLARWGTDGFAFRYITSPAPPPLASTIILFRSPSLTQSSSSSAPVLSSLSPVNAAAGSSAFALTVNGSGFVLGSSVNWNGVALATTDNSSTQLTAFVSATNLANAGTAQVTVVNPGGAVSAALPFTITAPQATLSSSALAFGAQQLNIASQAMQITLTNSGNGSMTAPVIAISGANTADFSQTNTCNASLSASATCNISVTFKPSATAAESAALTLTDNAASSPQIVALTGTGANPTFTLSASTLSFGSVSVNASSAASSITVTNSSAVALTGLAVNLTGANASDFVQTKTCSATIAPAAICSTSVTFKPSTGAAEQAALAVSVSGATTQTVTLTGTGVPDFATGIQGSSSSTVTAGQPANYNLQLSSAGGFSGSVSLTCSNLPLYASCTFNPSTITVSSGTDSNVTLTVSTQQTTVGALRAHEVTTLATGIFALLGLPLLGHRRRLNRCRMLSAWFCVVALVGAIALSGCSGGGSGSSTPQPTAHTTPAGNYTINVVANSGSTSHTTAITLVVQ